VDIGASIYIASARRRVPARRASRQRFNFREQAGLSAARSTFIQEEKDGH